MEMDHAAPEAALADEFESGLHAVGQRLLSTTDQDGVQKEMTFVDQSGDHRLGRQLGAAHGQVVGRGVLQTPNVWWRKLGLQPRPRVETSLIVRE